MSLKLATVADKTVGYTRREGATCETRRVHNTKENVRDIWRYRLVKLGEDIFQFVSTATNFQSFLKAGDL
jgi:hypothetical protein